MVVRVRVVAVSRTVEVIVVGDIRVRVVMDVIVGDIIVFVAVAISVAGIIVGIHVRDVAVRVVVRRSVGVGDIIVAWLLD
jgi:hypothetical protein